MSPIVPPPHPDVQMTDAIYLTETVDLILYISVEELGVCMDFSWKKENRGVIVILFHGGKQLFS